MPRGWAPSTEINRPRRSAINACSFTGVTKPVTYVMWLTMITFVRGVIAFSYRPTI